MASSSQKAAILLLVFAAVLALSPASSAEENITELKIEDLMEDVETGSVLKFSFLAGNRIGPPCTAQIEYWIGTEDVRIEQGQDNIFLGRGETTGQVSSLLVPDETMGIRGFYLQMQCNGTTILASKAIKVSKPLPVMLELSSLNVSENTEEKPVSFFYTIKSNQSGTLPIFVEESIIRDGNTVWNHSRESFIAVSNSFRKVGPLLPPGNYLLVVRATHGSKTAEITRGFAVGNALHIPLLLSIGALALVLFAAIAFTARYFWFAKRHYNKGFPAYPSPAEAAVTEQHSSKEEESGKNYVCLIESESGGVLDTASLKSLLQDAGFTENEKRTGIEFAKGINVTQKVVSSVFIDRFDKANCETSVTINVSNNTEKPWCDVAIIARIPGFLSENISEISVEGEVQAVKEGSVVRFVVPKIEAMQSASVVYSIAKWITQEKANEIPLPAVANYKSGKPLRVKIVKGKKAVEKSKKAAVACVARKKRTEKKAGRKKTGEVSK